MPQDRIELPPKYYLTYFEYLLKFVGDKYEHILNDAERAFMTAFAALTEDEKCLFVRFTNRKSSFFKTDKLNYSEINDIPQCLSLLQAKGFLIEVQNPVISIAKHIADALLEVFTKPELLSFLKQLKIETKGITTLKKEEILDFCLAQSQQQDRKSVV